MIFPNFMFDSIKFDKHFKKVCYQKPIKSTKINRIEKIKMKRGMLNIFLRKTLHSSFFSSCFHVFDCIFFLEFSRMIRGKDYSKIQWMRQAKHQVEADIYPNRFYSINIGKSFSIITGLVLFYCLKEREWTRLQGDAVI